MCFSCPLLTSWCPTPTQEHRSRQLGDLEAALEDMRLGQQQDLVGAEAQAGWVRIQVRMQRGLGMHQVNMHRRWVAFMGLCEYPGAHVWVEGPSGGSWGLQSRSG